MTILVVLVLFLACVYLFRHYFILSITFKKIT
jgi:hypothetical protein